MFSLAVGSVTTASRGKEALYKNGIRASLGRYSGEKRIGCGYVLNVSDNPDRCKAILSSYGIKVLDVIKK